MWFKEKLVQIPKKSFSQIILFSEMFEILRRKKNPTTKFCEGN
jgi:hypothetical protein